MKKNKNGFLLADSLLSLLVVLLAASLISVCVISLQKSESLTIREEIDRSCFRESE